MSVRTSPWAAYPAASQQELIDAMPAVLETYYNDWQERVDSRRDVSIGGFIGSLYPVRAIEYETVVENGRKLSRPAGVPDRTYLVIAASGFEAMDVVKAYLKVQAPDKAFGFGSNHAVTVLQKDA